ncbi:unnamed protein product (macronuclear) [Paramecium tetraurelia]|uniref:Uncharacterized protein n=1 Tax=Paramecium tetraurelia TaxID=5888 RepID=A0CSP1_PARTE|nr:uncharacterized protein GSPATT00010080001 [Paramecium tetraurelia]CAK73808.1 unnamed protein product [Paramecium tetraurelia]|eukprot:XP_001441205.1 hypothetical protein (macronuclear) [Paramecium tetraurelia strain d4-2]
MSIQLQQQIKNNALEIKEYIHDLYDWEESVNTAQKPQKKQNQQIDPNSVPIRGKVEQEKQSEILKKQLKRDQNSVQNYYDAWNKVDVDKLLEESDDPIVMDVYKKPQQTNINNKIVIKGGRNVIKSQVILNKEQANELFKLQEFQKAIEKYTDCIQELNQKQSLNEEELEQLVIIYSNRAQCQLKLLDYNQALLDCNKALSLNSNHQKSLLRRSTVLQELGKWKEALKDSEKLVLLGDQDAKQIVAKLQKKIQVKKENARNQLKQVKPFMNDSVTVQVIDQEKEDINVELKSNYLNEIDD